MIKKILILVFVIGFGANLSVALAADTPEEIAAKEAKYKARIVKNEAKLAKKEAKKAAKLAKKEAKLKKKRDKKLAKIEAKKKLIAARKKRAEEIKRLSTFTEAHEQQLDRIVQKFTKALNRDRNYYTYNIISDPNLNAFATLGRKLTMHSAVFHRIKSEAGIAMIVAHELGHIERKHVAKNMGVRGGIGIAGAIAGAFIGVNPAGLVNSTAGSAYSRSLERNADLFAIDLMNKLYCKTPGKLEIFNLISKGRKESKLFAYARSHPLTSKRKAYLTALIKDAGCVL
ncbi:MAG: M48 family metalloprotease [Candidatus Caenarcaniphilales bacterium]|nr:M48 family metalloprotease [Candidatus Caenarcaniphilales bacterium]